MRTSVRVTSSGSAYARFRRSLDIGSVTNALAAAAEIKPLGLTDSLELLLPLCDRGRPAFRGPPFAGTDATAVRST